MIDPKLGRTKEDLFLEASSSMTESMTNSEMDGS
jgi:hypothetical protein